MVAESHAGPSSAASPASQQAARRQLSENLPGSGKLVTVLQSKGVSPSVLRALQQAGYDAPAVCEAGAARIAALTACSLEEARTVVTVASQIVSGAILAPVFSSPSGEKEPPLVV